MTYSIVNILRLSLCGLLFVCVTAAADAAIYIKIDSIDGEAASQSQVWEITAVTRTSDIIAAIATRTGADARRIRVTHGGRVLSPNQILMQVRRTPLSCQIQPERGSRQKSQRESVSFCDQKIIWTLVPPGRGGTSYELRETEENLGRR